MRRLRRLARGKEIRRRTSGAGKGRPQLCDERKRGWTVQKKRVFLDTLAHTAHVERSAREAGISTSAAYRLRQRDPQFAVGWDKALDEGYRRLEELLLQIAMGHPAWTDEEGCAQERVPPDPALALKLLQLHKSRVAGIRAAKPSGRDPDVVLAEIKAKLAALREAK